DLWAWAKGLGVRHLDPVRLEDDDPLSPHLRHYRADLLAIGEEVCANLGDPQPPIDCQPLSRVVNQLMRRESFAGRPERSTAPRQGAGGVDPVAGEEAEPALVAAAWGAAARREPEPVPGAQPAAGLPCAHCSAPY